MDDLEQKLCLTKPREKDGARTGARFAFQAHVSISKILEWHAVGIDYVALFDFYDDLTVVEIADEGSRLHFFQIKAKGRGGWTAKSLATPEGKAPCTIVGKMYHNVKAFHGQPSIATFVSNTQYSFTLHDGRKTNEDDIRLSLSDLGAADRKTISNGLQLDFPAPRDPDESKVLRFEVTKVPSRHYDEMVLGEIAQLCKADSSAVGLYNTLIAEVTKRANDTQECISLQEIYQRKGLSRNELAILFENARLRVSILDVWNEIDAELRQEQRSLGSRVALRTKLVAYLERTAKRESVATALSRSIREKVAECRPELEVASTYLGASKLLRAKLDQSTAAGVSALELEAALLTEIHNTLYES